MTSTKIIKNKIYKTIDDVGAGIRPFPHRWSVSRNVLPSSYAVYGHGAALFVDGLPAVLWFHEWRFNTQGFSDGNTVFSQQIASILFFFAFFVAFNLVGTLY